MPNITTNHAITYTYYFYYIIMKDAKTAAAAVILWLIGLHIQDQVSHVQPWPLKPEFLYFLLCSTLLRGQTRCGSVERSDKVRLKLHFSPLAFFTYMYLQFRTSQRCGCMEQSDKVWIIIVTLFPLVMNSSSFQLYLVPHFSDVQICG